MRFARCATPELTNVQANPDLTRLPYHSSGIAIAAACRTETPAHRGCALNIGRLVRHYGTGMKNPLYVSAVLAAILCAAASAQTAPRALDLKLPPGSVPAQSASAAPEHTGNEPAAAAAMNTTVTSPAAGQTQPPLNYDEADDPYAESDAGAKRKCDDAAYGQAQVHGALTAGVVAGNHVSGNYQSGVVNVSKAFGSCDHPTGGVSVTIDAGQANLNGRRRHGSGIR
jgi:hypothetical protein